MLNYMTLVADRMLQGVTSPGFIQDSMLGGGGGATVIICSPISTVVVRNLDIVYLGGSYPPVPLPPSDSDLCF